jgi:predicted nuclease with TOPRIM domain
VAARAQLEAIRDEWLRPLVDRIGELERENGRLGERLDTTARERYELRTAVARLEAERSASAASVLPSPPVTGAANAGAAEMAPRRPWWKVWR